MICVNILRVGLEDAVGLPSSLSLTILAVLGVTCTVHFASLPLAEREVERRRILHGRPSGSASRGPRRSRAARARSLSPFSAAAPFTPVAPWPLTCLRAAARRAEPSRVERALEVEVRPIAQRFHRLLHDDRGLLCTPPNPLRRRRSPPSTPARDRLADAHAEARFFGTSEPRGIERYVPSTYTGRMSTPCFSARYATAGVNSRHLARRRARPLREQQHRRARSRSARRLTHARAGCRRDRSGAGS